MKIRRRYLFSMGILGGAWLLSLFFVYYVFLIPQQISLLKNKSRLLVYTVQEAAPTMNIPERQRFVEKMKRLNPELSYVLFLVQSGKAVAHPRENRAAIVSKDRYGKQARDNHKPGRSKAFRCAGGRLVEPEGQQRDAAQAQSGAPALHSRGDERALGD